jgi:hypothetical protein
MALLFVDNDILIKMAHWGLLDCVPAAFSSTWSDVATLESIRHRARRVDKKLFRDKATARILEERLANACELPGYDSAIFLLLQRVVDIDAGEVELISASAASPESYFLTGDKRALRSLAHPSLIEVAKLLANRVVCLEQLVLGAANLWGVDEVVARMATHRDLDVAIRCIVGMDGYTEANFREGLHSYIAALRAETGNLLLVQHPMFKESAGRRR